MARKTAKVLKALKFIDELELNEEETARVLQELELIYDNI